MTPNQENRPDPVDPLVSRFIKALRNLERTGELDAMVSLFDPEVEILSEDSQYRVYGLPAVYRIWRDHILRGSTIETRFNRVVQCGEIAVLTWRADAILESGARVHPEGVIVLEMKDDRIIRFRTFSNWVQVLSEQEARKRFSA